MTGTQTQPSHGSVTVTDAIAIRVEPMYMPDHSDPQAGRYVFAYTVHVANESDRTVKLLSRHWTVVDADGNRHDVEGEGVVGQQPSIQPGAAFEYSSWCPLGTPWGTMEGHYRLLADDGAEFNAAIARFYLVSDNA
jgi:ApaG protein